MHCLYHWSPSHVNPGQHASISSVQALSCSRHCCGKSPFSSQILDPSNSHDSLLSPPSLSHVRKFREQHPEPIGSVVVGLDVGDAVSGSDSDVGLDVGDAVSG